MSKKHEGLTFETRKLLGIRRAAAINAQIRANEGRSLPDDPDITENDFFCDAEQVEVTSEGKIVKSRPASETRPNN